jgi:hypothetical protein
MKNFTFSNGATVTPGTIVACPVSPIPGDNKFYPNAAAFDGFRFQGKGGGKGQRQALLCQYQAELLNVLVILVSPLFQINRGSP